MIDRVVPEEGVPPVRCRHLRGTWDRAKRYLSRPSSDDARSLTRLYSRTAFSCSIARKRLDCVQKFSQLLIEPPPPGVEDGHCPADPSLGCRPKVPGDCSRGKAHSTRPRSASLVRVAPSAHTALGDALVGVGVGVMVGVIVGIVVGVALVGDVVVGEALGASVVIVPSQLLYVAARVPPPLRLVSALSSGWTSCLHPEEWEPLPRQPVRTLPHRLALCRNEPPGWSQL